ncbi:MAG: arylesterase, partial [Desulfuromonadales bacterium]
MRFFKTYFILLLLACVCGQTAFANDTPETVTRLLVLGDSLAAGYGLAPEEAFPAQLEKALQQAGYRVSVINAGVSGDTTAGGLSRLSWTMSSDPQLVIVELGGNDALRGLPPEETRANLDAILEYLTSTGIKVILAGMRSPLNLGKDYTTAFDQIYPQLASKYQVAFYPFFLEGVALDAKLNQPDGIHPNAAGVKEIVTRFLPVVES